MSGEIGIMSTGASSGSSMNLNFMGKRVLVVGTSKQGVGYDLAIRLAKCNAKVIAMSKSQEPLTKIYAENPQIETVCVDVANWDQAREAVKRILPIDLLVNNANAVIIRPFTASEQEYFDVVFNLNVKAMFNVSQVVAANMIERKVAGSIVNVSSQASLSAMDMLSLYSSSKGAVDTLTKCMALELGPYNIRVNTVHPTAVLPDAAEKIWHASDMDDQRINIPLSRFAKNHEINDAILFLLSQHSTMITGSGIMVDGGFSAA